MEHSFEENKFQISESLRKAIMLLFYVMIIEIVLGGGGRFFVFGPVTLRMVLYLIAIPLSLLLIVTEKKISLQIALWTTLFFVLIFIAGILGIVSKANEADIFEDIKPLSFFFVLPFYSLCITTKKNVENVAKVIRTCSLILAIGYILLIILIFIGLIDFFAFYAWISPFNEVFFRNENFFFYKGFIYLCIGFFFFLNLKGFWNRIGLTVLLIAIVLTLTRGFILMTLVVTLLYFLFVHKNKLTSLILFIFAMVLFGIALPYYLNTIGDKSESDIVRYIQIDQVFKKTNPLNVILGDGFGMGVPIRPVHMEISYMEIFSKQGIVGLLFWFSIPVFLIISYSKMYKNKEAFLNLTPFLLSVILIYFQSGTNPYLNNPIGLNMILLSLVIFQKSKKLYKNP